MIKVGKFEFLNLDRQYPAMGGSASDHDFCHVYKDGRLVKTGEKKECWEWMHAQNALCDHHYVKAINYQVEDGVECAKCGQLWVQPKADMTQRILNWIDREIGRIQHKQPNLVAKQTLQDLRSEITKATP